jgi:hypothetical protein
MTPKQKERIRERLYVTNEYGITYQDPSAKLEEEDVVALGKEYGIKTDVHRMCINCQARQLLTYENKKHPKTGEPENKFRVRCDFVPNELPQGSATAVQSLVAKGMSLDRARMLVESSVDPSAWASLMFGFEEPTAEELAAEAYVPKPGEDAPKRPHLWYLRNYQKEQLRCSSERIVIREGRRSGKSFAMALKLIYLAFNRLENRGRDGDGNVIRQGPSIMVVTPFQSQLRNIFDELENLLKRNTTLMEEVETRNGGSLYVKTPFFRMEFSNGGKISGFVSGVGSKTDGSGGGVIRGQTASIIYLDEMDMIPDEVLDKAVIPILISYPDTMLLATSTPIGKRGRFWNWCVNSPDWKQDFLPSTVLPQWETQKDMIEAENSADAFRAEYLAEFIDGAHGVFRASLVHEAQQDYTYKQTRDPTWWRDFCQVLAPKELVYCMGIDWNKNAGTEFVVVALDPATARFIVVDSVNIPAGQFSALVWKEEVVRLNHKWRPEFIYADEGYGHTIIEDLQHWAMTLRSKPGKSFVEQQAQHLDKRLISFSFRRKIELRNPVTNQTMEKEGKDFLIENAVRVFEDKKLWYPLEDEMMRRQLLNYVVLRTTPTGRKVHGPENDIIGDHRLDALMLALGGLSLEYGVFSPRGTSASEVAAFSRDELMQRGQSDLSEGAGALSALRKAGGVAGGAHLTMLELMGGRPNQKELAITTRRGSAGIGQEKTVFEYFNERATSAAGYSTDQEHLYQKEEPLQNIRKRGSVTRKRGRLRRGLKR